MKRLTAAAALLLAVAAWAWSVAGPPSPATSSQAGFQFAALGDSPYYPWEEARYRVVRQDLAQHELAVVLHIGDIFWQPCSDERYRKTLRQFDALPHPVVYTPGDNEWLDCWEPRPGGYDPLERLDRLREIFFAQPRASLGGRTLELAVQAEDPAWPEFVENARWEHEGVVFATAHLVGRPWHPSGEVPGWGEANERAAQRQVAAAVEWFVAALELAGRNAAPAAVLAFHANPAWEAEAEADWVAEYAPFTHPIAAAVAAFGRPVLAIHGDSHDYTVDQPLLDPTTGKAVANFTRLQVPGSPLVGWVRVEFRPGEDPPWAFEERVVPQWKLW